MVFNEILTPQDPFTETNVTRKKIHRRKSVIIFRNQILLKLPHLIIYFYILEKNGMK